jgi:hypothetical protein
MPESDRRESQASMLRHVGARTVSDTGSTTGVATVILALLSAGTVASLTVVGVQQLAPDFSGRLRIGEPSALLAPTKVVVTPRPAAPTTGSDSVLRQAKPRAPSPSAVTVVPAVRTSPATVVATHSPHVTVPRVHKHRPTVTVPTVTIPTVTVPTVTVPTVTVPTLTTPAVTTPAVTTPAVTTPAVAIAVVATQSVVASAPALSPGSAVNAKRSPGYPDRGSTRQQPPRAVVAETPSRDDTAAVLAEKQSSSPADTGACGEQADGDHHDVYGGRGHDRNGH